jgi:hypothetical protein
MVPVRDWDQPSTQNVLEGEEIDMAVYEVNIFQQLINQHVPWVLIQLAAVLSLHTPFETNRPATAFVARPACFSRTRPRAFCSNATSCTGSFELTRLAFRSM